MYGFRTMTENLTQAPSAADVLGCIDHFVDLCRRAAAGDEAAAAEFSTMVAAQHTWALAARNALKRLVDAFDEAAITAARDERGARIIDRVSVSHDLVAVASDLVDAYDLTDLGGGVLS
jgi:hypothetical protein